MGVNIIEKIDKCTYCEKKAEYFWLRGGFLETRWRFLCEEHRKMREQLK